MPVTQRLVVEYVALLHRSVAPVLPPVDRNQLGRPERLWLVHIVVDDVVELRPIRVFLRFELPELVLVPGYLKKNPIVYVVILD